MPGGAGPSALELDGATRAQGLRFTPAFNNHRLGVARFRAERRISPDDGEAKPMTPVAEREIQFPKGFWPQWPEHDAVTPDLQPREAAL